MRDEARHEHQIKRAIAESLIGDIHLAASRIARGRHHISLQAATSDGPPIPTRPLDETVKQHVATPRNEQHDGVERWSSGQSEAEHPGRARDSGSAPGCDGAAEVSWHATAGLQRTCEENRRARECEQSAIPEFAAACEGRPGRPVAYPQVTGQSAAQHAEYSSRGGRRERARILDPGRIGAKSQRPGRHAGSSRGRIDAGRKGR